MLSLEHLAMSWPFSRGDVFSENGFHIHLESLLILTREDSDKEHFWHLASSMLFKSCLPNVLLLSLVPMMTGHCQ